MTMHLQEIEEVDESPEEVGDCREREGLPLHDTTVRQIRHWGENGVFSDTSFEGTVWFDRWNERLTF